MVLVASRVFILFVARWITEFVSIRLCFLIFRVIVNIVEFLSLFSCITFNGVILWQTFNSLFAISITTVRCLILLFFLHSIFISVCKFLFYFFPLWLLLCFRRFTYLACFYQRLLMLILITMVVYWLALKRWKLNSKLIRFFLIFLNN